MVEEGTAGAEVMAVLAEEVAGIVDEEVMVEATSAIWIIYLYLRRSSKT